MSHHRQARGLLGSQIDLLGRQQLAQVLEAHGRLHQRHAPGRRDGIQQVRGGHCPSQALGPAAGVGQIVRHQRQDQVGRHVVPVAIDDGKAIAIAIGGDPQIEAALGNPDRQLAQVRLRAVRGLAAEQDITEVMQGLARQAGAPQDLVEVAPAGAPARAECDLEAGLADGLKLHQLGHAIEVGTAHVHRLHAPDVVRRLVHRRDLFQALLQIPGDRARRWQTLVGGELQPAVRGWVVAGGEVDRPGQPAHHHGMGDHRRGHRCVAHQSLYSGGRQRATGLLGKPVHEKAGVVAHQHRAVAQPLIPDMAGDGGDQPADLGERELLGDERSPARRPESNRLLHKIFQITTLHDGPLYHGRAEIAMPDRFLGHTADAAPA